MSKIGNYIIDRLEQGEEIEEIITKGFVKNENN